METRLCVCCTRSRTAPLLHPPRSGRDASALITARNAGYDGQSLGEAKFVFWCRFANYLAQFFARYFASWKEFNQEVVEILVLLTRLLFSCDILRRLPRRVSQAKQTSAAWRC
jgi:hypothetical protein